MSAVKVPFQYINPTNKQAALQSMKKIEHIRPPVPNDSPACTALHAQHV